MEFVADDLAAAEPTDAELKAYLPAHPERFRTPDRVSFRHVFLNARREGSLEADAQDVALKLARMQIRGETPPGDAFLLGDAFRDFARRVARTLGDRFARGALRAGGRGLAGADRFRLWPALRFHRCAYVGNRAVARRDPAGGRTRMGERQAPRDAGGVLPAPCARATRSSFGGAGGRARCGGCGQMTRFLLDPALVARGRAPVAAWAHEVRPGYLELRQTPPTPIDVLFKVPALGEELRLGLYPGCRRRRRTWSRRGPSSPWRHVERRTVNAPGGLARTADRDRRAVGDPYRRAGAGRGSRWRHPDGAADADGRRLHRRGHAGDWPKWPPPTCASASSTSCSASTTSCSCWRCSSLCGIGGGSPSP